MSKSTSVVLGDKLTDFIDEQVAGGSYGSSSEVVRAGLRLLQEHDSRVAALRAAIIDGELSGEPQPFDFDAFIARKQRGE